MQIDTVWAKLGTTGKWLEVPVPPKEQRIQPKGDSLVHRYSEGWEGLEWHGSDEWVTSGLLGQNGINTAIYAHSHFGDGRYVETYIMTHCDN